MQLQLNNRTVQIPAKLYRIGDLVRHTPFSRQTIHNYTVMGLITEAEWTEGGHRLYDESVFEVLLKINQLKKTKTLFEINQILRKERSQYYPQSVDQKVCDTAEEKDHHTHSVQRQEGNK
jgi:DNA-binding transcriptional MerR regulator